MRGPSVVAVLALLAPVAAAGTHEEPSVYYYVDSGCRDCAPDDGLEAGDYWVITDAVHRAPREGLDRVAERYRGAVRRHFTRPDALLGNVVVRFRDTADQARGGRLQKVEKMRERGYRVLEIGLDAPETGPGSPDDGAGKAPARAQ